MEWMDTMYIPWVIAWKDILDGLKDKATRINLLFILGFVVFFSWYSNVRPWDKRIDTVVYDEGSTSLSFNQPELADGYSFQFYGVTSMPEMERMMALKGSGLVVGLVLPADFDQSLAAAEVLSLEGYILWVDREQKGELEALYSEKFTELLGRQVQVQVGENIVIPPPDVQSTSTNFTLFFSIFWMAFMLIPHLMLEEKRTRTLDSLMVSPATTWQVVIGKGLSGLFYIGLAGGLSLALNRAYIADWRLALAAFAVTIVFAIGAGLAAGSFLTSAQQLNLWGWVINIFLLVPAMIALDPLLASGLRLVFSLIPTAAMVKLFQFSFSTGISPLQLWMNLAVALTWTGLIYAMVVWKVRRSET